MTKPKRYKRYSVEFKREAIRRGSEEGTTDAAVCAELGISTRQFRRWRDELQLLGNDAFPGQGRTRDEELTDLPPVLELPSPNVGLLYEKLTQVITRLCHLCDKKVHKFVFRNKGYS